MHAPFNMKLRAGFHAKSMFIQIFDDGIYCTLFIKEDGKAHSLESPSRW